MGFMLILSWVHCSTNKVMFLRLDRKVNKDKEKPKEEVCFMSQKPIEETAFGF